MAIDPTHPTELASITPIVDEFIVATPDTCNGEPRIVGTRIKVRHVFVWVEQAGKTPAQVVAEYPHLTMAQVHAALAYYWSHRDAIHADIARSDRRVESIRADAGPSLVARKLASHGPVHGPDDPLPSR